MVIFNNKVTITEYQKERNKGKEQHSDTSKIQLRNFLLITLFGGCFSTNLQSIIC